MLVNRLLFTAAIVAFAAAALASGMDRLSANEPGLERLVPMPFRAQADRSAATTALDKRDTRAAIASSRNAVSQDPVDPDATASLGSALMLAGRINDAARTFRIAARFGWRNAATQAFWYDAALQTGDYGVAADRLDALLRVHPRLVDQAGILRPMESDQAAREALAARLRFRPPWLDRYLAVQDDTPSDVIDGRLSVVSVIDSARFPLGCDSVAPLARALLDSGRRRDAEGLWNANCPSMKVAGLIIDPTFAQVINSKSSNPFSWQLMGSGDLSIGQLSVRSGDRSLVLINSAPGTRLIFVQTVALPAGLYRFHATQGSGAPPTRGKLYLSWACEGKPPFPGTSAGDLLVGGEYIRVSPCDRQQIGIWLTGGGKAVSLQSISLDKIR